MHQSMTNVILCGGSGTRLWPISRTLMPKQFITLFGSKSLFQLTVERNAKLCDSQMIVSNAEQYFLALDQLEEIKQTNHCCILEPVGRNTAPAIALACLALNESELVLVTPSDHLIRNEAEYASVVMRAAEFALAGKLVTFGITPTSAETGFGYIEKVGDFDVKAFHEKPDLATAKQYLQEGDYYWNSGMFLFKAGVYLQALEQYAPEIYIAAKQAFHNADYQGTLIRIKTNDMLAIPANSIDYAVMEQATDVKVIPSDIDWSDVGSFDTLYQELPKDKDGNTENDHHLPLHSKNNLVYGKERLIATIDIEDLIIVDTGDALLVSKRGSSQKVKEIVAEVKKSTQLADIHLTGYRPWGSYTVLEVGAGYKIKKIEVKPGKRLSLQRHQHRNEHWIVVSGTATVTIEDRVKLVRPNESIYINIGDAHRLANEGRIPLVLIEVQTGDYTGEDDIERLEDDYARGN